jgi:transcription initiation factor TFIIIB Brf1 subunit/transcription initiation factor TFIIB
MCFHENVLDDFHTADVVCTDCGLVLDRIVGFSGTGGQQWNSRPCQYRQTQLQPPLPPPILISPPSTGGKEARRKIENYLSVFFMDNENVVESVLKKYNLIYGTRVQRPGFRKCNMKERIAIAFSICNTLANEEMPRPPQYIAKLCGVSCRQLLNTVTHLKLSEEELEKMKREDYELASSPPQDYIDVLCSHLGIPFATGGEMRAVAEEARWILHGRYPTVIAAASMQLVLERRGELNKTVFAEKICEMLDCQQKTVNLSLKALMLV